MSEKHAHGVAGDTASLQAELAALAHGLAPLSPDLRSAYVAHLKDVLQKGRAEAERRLLANGRGTQCAKLISDLQDRIISALHGVLTADGGAAFAVVAVGGYGRGTLAPGSDIDLLFLLAGKEDARTSKLIEFILYTLWDLRQKVGHATRSVEESISFAKSDSTIMTAILESRLICGDHALHERLQEAYRTNILRKGAKDFVNAKLAERDLRLARGRDSRYMVEPDLKDGKGGLRDLQTIFWIAKFVYDAKSPEELAEKGAFTREELRNFQKCENFLWAVRCHLHFVAGRGEDRLSFDRQAEMAQRLGYQAHGGLRNVERFMKHYFLIAKEVGDLTRIFCASLEARQMKDAPVLSRMMASLRGRPRGMSGNHQGFRMESGRISIAQPDSFERDPLNLIRIFLAAQQAEAEIHPDALKAVRRSLPLINAAFRASPEANRIFLDILTGSLEAETLLRMMNEAGVLGRFIPDFGRVVAMMQFNMYHHYTVDEHLIRAVGILAEIERGTQKEDHPLASEIFPTIKGRRALYVAVLLHDIAKGRPEDHSVAGERIALQLGPRLGLTPEETETAAWLVRHHLLMSETAQMRDLNDFKTILDFTSIVQSPERLKLLLILTVVDIRAVGPGVWNGWKGQLLRTLYAEAEPLLTGGHASTTRAMRVAAAQETFLSQFPEWSEEKRKAALARHYDGYWLTSSLEKQVAHQRLLDRAAPGAILTEIRTDAFTAITELTVFAPDHPRLLALITGACAAAGANIAGAQIFTTTDGMALDTILIQREFPEEADELRRADRVSEIIRKALEGKIRLKERVAHAASAKPRVKAFTVEPRVIIDNQSSNRYTVVEINGLDRIGLLYNLTEALFSLSLNIASAQITTFGEKAIDVFYVTDLTGDKITSASRQSQIEKQLMAVLKPAAEKAMA
jgi:[protein-PII] uridylyltransferase